MNPAVAGGGVLTDHGWHVFYVVPAWVGSPPLSVGARLETRRHTTFAVEDTASVRLEFADATADVLLTWAAEERRNRVEVHGTEGRIELQGDTLVLTGKDGERRWPGLPPLADGSHHPDWFHAVADEFVAEVPLGDDGGFRFFAAPGSWTLRVLAPNGLRAEQSVQADHGQVTKVEVSL